MSRSGYSDDGDIENWELIRWRGAVASAIRGNRGQAFLRDLLNALDAMPEKRLIADDLIQPDGAVCAIGALGKVRGVDMTKLYPDDREAVAQTFGIAPALAAEIVYMNDDVFYAQTPEGRWTQMRKWISGLLKDDASEKVPAVP